MKALYAVTTRNVSIERTEEGRLYTGLTVFWEAMQRDEPPVALDKALPDPDKPYAAGYIEALFTLEEAHAITAFASQEWPKSETDVKAIILPLSSTDGLAPLGVMWDYEQGDLESDSVRAHALFNLRDAENVYEKERGEYMRSVRLPLEVADYLDKCQKHGRSISHLPQLDKMLQELYTKMAQGWTPDQDLPF